MTTTSLPAPIGADDQPTPADLEAERIHEEVRDHYARAALAVREAQRAGGASATTASGASATTEDCCDGSADCGASCGADAAAIDGAALYSALERDSVPSAALLASLGCGNPFMVAELEEGERVLDLGSGGGIDVLLSAKRVGPSGRAFGLDMTDEMLALARRNAEAAGATNVEFLRGYIESIPLPADSIDVVISNCVVNLAADKPAVFREIARVLRPGGRIGIADVVADDALSAEERAERGSYAGCVAGALSFSEYRAGLAAAGFEAISITAANGEQGIFSALIKATKPAD
jgi:arsenite methyltransferase